MNKTLVISLLVLAVIFAVLSFILLPDTVATQIGTDDEVSSTMPKIPAVAVPLVMTAAGTLIALKGSGDSPKKGLILQIAGIVILAFTFFFNLHR